MVDLSNYISAGYFLMRASNPDGSLKDKLPPERIELVKLNQGGLLPEYIISFSAHMLSRKLEVTWGWNPGNPQAALDFGVPEAKLEEFLDWCAFDYSYSADMDVWSMFYSADAARRLARKFEIDTNNLYIIGAGLHKELEPRAWLQAPQPDQKAFGIEKRVGQRLPVDAGGEVIGYELVGFSHNTFSCSWLCNYLHLDMFDLFKIRPNKYGLIDTYAEAKKVLDWINEDPKARAEPIPYDVWLLVSYPLKTEDGL